MTREKQNINCAVFFHVGGGELNDMQELEERKQEKINFKRRRVEIWKQIAGKTQVGTTYVCEKLGKTGIHEQMKGNC